MKITKAQRWKILELWGRVCADRGWKVSDRALRLSTIGGILGRELLTLDDIGRLDECTKVMAELGCMVGDDLRAGLEASDPGLNRKRNWRHLIVYDVMPCLALYEDRPEVYLRTVLESKSRYRKTDRPESPARLDDFDERTVQMVFWTLNARLNTKRKAAGHSGHDMRTQAGVPCSCAACRNAQVVPPISMEADASEDHAHVHDGCDENFF